jgi:hypothetical protein
MRIVLPGKPSRASRSLDGVEICLSATKRKRRTASIEQRLECRHDIGRSMLRRLSSLRRALSDRIGEPGRRLIPTLLGLRDVVQRFVEAPEIEQRDGAVVPTPSVGRIQLDRTGLVR